MVAFFEGNKLLRCMNENTIGGPPIAMRQNPGRNASNPPAVATTKRISEWIVQSSKKKIVVKERGLTCCVGDGEEDESTREEEGSQHARQPRSKLVEKGSGGPNGDRK